MQFALNFQHRGSVHASEIGWAWQNIQDYIFHKSEGVNFLKAKVNDTFLMTEIKFLF